MKQMRAEFKKEIYRSFQLYQPLDLLGSFKMKYLAILTILLTALTLKSCSFNDSEMVYEEKLVVFASISANLPVLDTVLVSKTAQIQDEVMADDLWINNAQVKLIETSSNSILNFFNVGQGKYFPVSSESSPEDLENYLMFY